MLKKGLIGFAVLIGIVRLGVIALIVIGLLALIATPFLFGRVRR